MVNFSFTINHRVENKDSSIMGAKTDFILEGSLKGKKEEAI